MKSKQHFNKDISATAFTNSCQHLQFIYNAKNHLNPKDNYRYKRQNTIYNRKQNIKSINVFYRFLIEAI